VSFNRLASLIVVACYLPIIARAGAWRMIPALFAGLLFIWLPREMSFLAAQDPRMSHDPDSPPCLMIAVGWFVLALPAFLMLVVRYAYLLY